MPFCQSCGVSVEGKFCPKCGTPAGGPAPGADQTLRVGGVGVIKMSDIRAFKY